eukprot:CAMPEP_0113562570 /NCGR_PEP_ID=MMETSP0015_2-20120614/20598_1 /TAXON_ID=2838 /ORGANISM="Odontella" /LENGTH=70 /DNA_ID=CAMNT_0000464477 /DNA_START=331 /DNA_END=539 /DNA_ORIENTATION=+ /assembly_acc=CAM_ASM_000160
MPKNKGVKMSMTDFLGGAPKTDMDMLPSRPKERGADDDGSFQRNRGRKDDRGGGGGFGDDGPSRSEADSA